MTTEPETTAAKPGFFRRLASAPRRLWDRIGPARRTRRATAWFAALLALALGAAMSGLELQSGWGPWADVGIGAGVALAVLILAPLAVAVLLGLTRFVRSTIGGLGFGAFVAIAVALDAVGLPESLVFLGAGAMLLATMLVFGSLAVMTKDFGAASTFKRVFASGSLLVGLGGFVVGTWWVLDRGSQAHLTVPVVDAGAQPDPLTAADPGAAGAFAVKSLTYGSGTDRRPEFGEQAAIQTAPVNGKPFTKNPSGWQGKLRKKYWGFDVGRLPLNGRVWYPDAAGPFPLILVVHGNHLMTDYSDPGYEYLGQHFASRGFILVSVDENFLNGGGPLFGSMAKENDARAWILLKHLELWRGFHAAPDGPFEGRVDMDKVGLIGHSRGGEAVYHAALFNRLKHYPDDASVTFDFGFSIRGVIAIAPSDGQYKPASRYAVARDVNFFVIQGGHDADVSSFVGDRMYERLRFDEMATGFKASLFVYRANHGQFNTTWGDADRSTPMAQLLNRAALLSGAEQRQIAKVFFGAFFEASLLGRHEYVELFRDPRRGREWLPATPMISRFEDPSFVSVADFDEDFDVTTIPGGGTVAAAGLVIWREGDIRLRSGTRFNTGVYLGWKREAEDAAAASYAIALPADQEIGSADTLVLHLAAVEEKPKAKDYAVDDASKAADENGDDENGDEESEDEENADEKKGASESEPDPKAPQPAYDLTVELTAKDGTVASLPLSRFGALLPPLLSTFTRSSLTEQGYKSAEPNLQTFELPLEAFAAAVPEFRPADVTKIRLVFDRTTEGVVVLDRVGFTRRGPAR